jgi:hypothetical protein
LLMQGETRTFPEIYASGCESFAATVWKVN